MENRTLKGATGLLYGQRTDAVFMALDQLREAMLGCGYVVAKRAPRYTTLVAYPQKNRRYPLLNPYFDPSAEGLDEDWAREVLALHVISKGQVAQEKLEQFESTDERAFIPTGSPTDKYTSHGYFLVPTRFFGESPDYQIDFVALRQPLTTIREFLIRL